VEDSLRQVSTTSSSCVLLATGAAVDGRGDGIGTTEELLACHPR
jgi:hypothetical protein